MSGRQHELREPSARVGRFRGVRGEGDEATVCSRGLRLAAGTLLRSRQLVGEIRVGRIERGRAAELIACRDAIPQDGRLLAALREVAGLAHAFGGGRSG